jgi:hypothetical protein
MDWTKLRNIKPNYKALEASARRFVERSNDYAAALKRNDANTDAIFKDVIRIWGDAMAARLGHDPATLSREQREQFAEEAAEMLHNDLLALLGDPAFGKDIDLGSEEGK